MQQTIRWNFGQNCWSVSNTNRDVTKISKHCEHASFELYYFCLFKSSPMHWNVSIVQFCSLAELTCGKTVINKRSTIMTITTISSFNINWQINDFLNSRIQPSCLSMTNTAIRRVNYNVALRQYIGLQYFTWHTLLVRRWYDDSD